MKHDKIALLSFAVILITVTSIIWWSQPREPKMLDLPQGDNYAAQWAQVDTFTNKGLPKSAYAQVQKIYFQARAEHNDVQLLKCAIHAGRYVGQVEDDWELKAVNWFKAGTNGTEFPLKQAFHSLLGQIYSTYALNHQWQFAGRTATAANLPEDHRTWDMERLANEADLQYQLSLSQADDLRRVPIDFVNPVLDIHFEGRAYRPTLWDLLAWRALGFYSNERIGVTQPAFQYRMDDPALYSIGDRFLTMDFSKFDPNSYQVKSLRIYQALAQQHRYDKNPTARVKIDLQRLQYVGQHGVMEGKDSLWMGALRILYRQHEDHEASAMVAAEIATRYANTPHDPFGPNAALTCDARKKAMAYLDAAISEYRESDGGRACNTLRLQLIARDFNVTLGAVHVPDKPILASLSYQNISHLWLRLVQQPKELPLSNKGDALDIQINHLLWQPAFKKWELNLPQDNDYNAHRAEFKLPALPLGSYALLVGSSADFETDSEAVALASFQVSHLGYTVRRMPTGNNEYLVTDRSNGQPQPGIITRVFHQIYNYDESDYHWQFLSTLPTNADGLLSMPHIPNGNECIVEFIQGNDTLITTPDWQYYNAPADRKMRRRTTFFTDRAIYRPGQTVYFKAIVMEGNGETTRILPNVSEQVTFKDANGQEIKTLSLKTNEFGSVAGSFIAPEGQMNGSMTIRDDFGSISISVEDYKRPQFEVTFDPIKGSFQLGNAVKVKGKALAFSGANIAEAEVRYRVQRTATFPWCGFWGWRWSLPNSPAMEIAHGSVKTDAFGAFEIEFEAIPDPSLSKDARPNFSYEVTADVVDITGETHSATTHASVGYQAIDLHIAVPAQVEQSSFKGLKILANNLNGEPEPTQGQIQIHRIARPERYLQPREWERPDRFLMTKAEFNQDFPGLVYDNENDPALRPILEQVYAGKFDTKKSDSLKLAGMARWPQGEYELVANCKDKFGTEVKYQQRFMVYSQSAKTLPTPAPLWVAGLKAQYEPGDTAIIDFGTLYAGAWLHYAVSVKGVSKAEWKQIPQGRTQIKFPILEQHRGNVNIALLLVRDGRVQQESLSLVVPWTNKQLDIEYATFRDKMLPGSKEEWTVKIKGHTGEKAAAELLAGMYDQSLDAFQTNYWGLNVDPIYGSTSDWEYGGAFGATIGQLSGKNWNAYAYDPTIYYDDFQFFDPGAYGLYGLQNGFSYAYANPDAFSFADEPAPPPVNATWDYEDANVTKDELSLGKFRFGSGTANGQTASFASNKPTSAASYYMDDTEISGAKAAMGSPALDKVAVRTNLNECAFFLPQLRTDAEGNVIFKFTMPEALTKWKFRTFAHTKDLKTGYKETTVQTQKELMVQPNPPRFFRENDVLVYTAKLSNLTEKYLQGQARLELLNALTMKPIDRELGNAQATQAFSLKAGQSVVLTWKLKIPAGIEAVTHRVKAIAGNVSDGEENSLPVLSNSMLVTEAMPMPVRPLETKSFDFKRLTSNKSNTLRQHKLTLEFTSNPAWYAIQALPYMMEYPYECIEQTFSRYYANSIATHIANQHPRIKAVFEQWKSAGAAAGKDAALLSKLEKNQELKALLLEETPWVMDAQDESTRKQRIGLLFDLSKMAQSQGRARQKLIQAQVANGGFTWFPGMPESRYMTQHIVCGLGHLDHLGIKEFRTDAGMTSLCQRAIWYLDDKIREDHEILLRNVKPGEMDLQHIGWDQIQFLYARSFFQALPIKSGCERAVAYYVGQARKYWLEFNHYNQGMIALALHRGGDKVTPPAILRSIKEFSQHSDEMGMYWKADGDGMYWYQAPIETQALLIEAFGEVTNDQAAVEEMKLWLLKQKQTQDWKTTKATAEACYALLLGGADDLAESKLADITIGGQHLDPTNDPALKVEAGTGYFKTTWSGDAIRPNMGHVEVKNNNKVAAWGALYWQYFEQLDKITFAPNKVSIHKQLFLQENSATGPKLSAISDGAQLKPGDLVKVRIILETDRDMEYVHMKDMRASGFEPINVLSHYKWQDGLGYYESTRDAATNFFIDWLPKGKYVFEYPLRATYQGDFSNGITTVQCMYAPEFTSHSEGVRVRIGG